MRHTKQRFVPGLVHPLIVGGALCSALAPVGCQSPEAKKDGEATPTEPVAEGGEAADAGDDGGARDGDPGTTREPPKAESPADEVFPIVPNVLPHAKGEIFGHVVMPNTSRFIKDVQGSLKVPAVSLFFNEEIIRAQAGAALGDRAAVAKKLELDAPIGCAVADFKQYEPAPVACAFGYEGGVLALMDDLGEEGKLDAASLGASGHAAVYELEGQNLYFDSLGDYVVVSPHTELFGKTKDYLQANVVDRGKSIRGDIEAVVFVADAMEFYRQDLQPFLDEMEAASSQTLPTMGAPQLDQLLAAWGKYNAENSRRSIDMLRNIEQLSMHFGVEDFGVFIGGSLVPRAGSELEADMKKSHSPRIDKALAASAPETTVALFAYGSSDAAWDTTQATKAREILIHSWATATGRDEASAKAAVDLFYEKSKETYGNQHVMFIADQEGALFGIGSVTTLEEGKSGRETFKAWSAQFTPEAILGEVAAEYVTWKFQFDHATVEGAPVDRWRIEPTDKAKQALESELGLSKKDWKQIDTYIGELALEFDRAEVDGRAVFTFAPKATDAFTKSVIEAQKGKGSLQGNAGLDALLAHHPAATGAFGLDVARFVAWLRGVPGLEDLMTVLPEDAALGNDLTDTFMVTETREDGVVALEFVLSTKLIDQVVALGNSLSAGGL